MNDVLLLSAALGFPIEKPSAPVTRSVRMLFKDRSIIEPYKEKKSFKRLENRSNRRNALNESQKTILRIVERGGQVTGVSAASYTKWTRNHCSMILTSLFKLGLIKRYKVNGSGTRWFVYVKKDFL